MAKLTKENMMNCRIANDSKYLNHNREYIEEYNDVCPIEKTDIISIKDGIVLPKSELFISKGGVLDDRHRFVEASSIEDNGSFICINGGYEIDSCDRSQYDNSVIYLGYFFRHWGHFLMDCTTRMWILLDERYKDYKIVFPNHPAHVCDGNYTRFLELIGVTKERIIPVEVPMQFKEVIIPTEARYQPGNSHLDEWYRIFDRVVDNASYKVDDVPKRVYFSRAHLSKKEFGLEEIEHNYRLNGYDVLYPEELSLDEQIGIFRCADEIVSENSSICMNVVFAKPGLKWTVINKYSVAHDNFTELRYRKNLDITYVDAFNPKLDIYGQKIGSLPYLISFNRNMKQMFDDRGMRYETFGKSYRISNICKYLICCACHRSQVWMRKTAAKIVRWMKRYTPGFHGFLKRVLG